MKITVLRGDGRSNMIDGTSGWDIISGYAGADTIMGRGGDDDIEGNLGRDVLFGNQGNDALTGGHGADRLYGGFGADFLYGGSGNDVIFGGFGQDLIVGGHGADRLFGGVGADTFLFNLHEEGTDTIRDFTNQDRIVVDVEIPGDFRFIEDNGCKPAKVKDHYDTFIQRDGALWFNPEGKDTPEMLVAYVEGVQAHQISLI